ncbi:MAG: hypothetical protein RLZZ70_172 [Candidatus Parcubacteria bacterium]|jgi:uncharacterized membrane protein YdjX (TVP38/TMEM64 family)
MRIIGVLIGGAIFCGIVWYTGLLEWLSVDAITTLVTDLGWYGGIAFVGIYMLASVLFVPGTPLTILAGVLFGPVYGVLYTVVGATLGAGLLFLLARYVGRDAIVTYVARHARLQEYDRQLAKDGFMTVFILRLIPLFPFNGLNLALGLTPVRFKTYLLATVLGIIPGTTALVYFGSALATVNIWQIILAVLALIGLTYGGKWLAVRYKKHA